jgi:DNA-binding NarL/FixJ family response regulator
VIGEDSLLLREGIARVLESGGLQVVALTGDLDSLLAAVAEHRPDVAVVDIRMPPTQTDEGLRAARQIRAERPETGVLVLSQYLDEDYVFTLLGNGAQGLGYLLKDRVTDGDAFVDAVRRVAAGEAALDPDVVAHLLGRRGPGGPLEDLTDRERTVLGEMAEGRSNGAIAARLFLSDRAVERHVTAIFSKLSLTATPDSHRRVLAVLTYLRA